MLRSILIGNSEVLFLLEGGITPCRRLLRDTIRKENVCITISIWRLFVQFGIDPFHNYDQDNDEEEDDEDDEEDKRTRRVLNSLWSFGMSDSLQMVAGTITAMENADASIDILCRDTRASIHAVTLLVEERI
jgi:hypothetical protein